MFETEDINNQRVAVIGIFAAVLIFLAIVAAQVLFYRVEKAGMAVKDAAKPRELVDEQTEQAQSLTTYRWVDRDTETVTIPIKRAMQLEVEKLAGVRQ